LGKYLATYSTLRKVQPSTGASAFGSYLIKWEYKGIIEMGKVGKRGLLLRLTGRKTR